MFHRTHLLVYFVISWLRPLSIKTFCYRLFFMNAHLRLYNVQLKWSAWCWCWFRPPCDRSVRLVLSQFRSFQMKPLNCLSLKFVRVCCCFFFLRVHSQQHKMSRNSARNVKIYVWKKLWATGWKNAILNQTNISCVRHVIFQLEFAFFQLRRTKIHFALCQLHGQSSLNVSCNEQINCTVWNRPLTVESAWNWASRRKPLNISWFCTRNSYMAQCEWLRWFGFICLSLFNCICNGMNQMLCLHVLLDALNLRCVACHCLALNDLMIEQWPFLRTTQNRDTPNRNNKAQIFSELINFNEFLRITRKKLEKFFVRCQSTFEYKEVHCQNDVFNCTLCAALRLCMVVFMVPSQTIRMKRGRKREREGERQRVKKRAPNDNKILRSWNWA